MSTDTATISLLMISCGTSSNFETLTLLKRKSFADSPIDTAKVEETQRHKTRHVGASKPAFRERLSSILTRWHCQKGKPETWNETCWSIKASISCEMSSKFDTLTRSKRKVLHVALFIWIWQRLNQKKSIPKMPWWGWGSPFWRSKSDFGVPNLYRIRNLPNM